MGLFYLCIHQYIKIENHLLNNIESRIIVLKLKGYDISYRFSHNLPLISNFLTTLILSKIHTSMNIFDERANHSNNNSKLIGYLRTDMFRPV